MRHGLDHIVHAVRDLDAAAEFYARAGFTVVARNRHASRPLKRVDRPGAARHGRA
jgi:catechol 2,3-dioxygenase-like lactoylglutathione lyase family enzyme